MNVASSIRDGLSKNLKNFILDPLRGASAFAQAYPPPQLHSLADVDHYVRSLDIDVEYVNTLPSSIHGRMDICNEQAYIIVNQRDHPARQAFTILHELCHLVFDCQVIPMDFTIDSKTPDPKEPALHTFHIKEEVFAFYLLNFHGSPEFRDRVLKANPEPNSIAVVGVMLAGLWLLATGYTFLKPRLFPETPRSKKIGQL